MAAWPHPRSVAFWAVIVLASVALTIRPLVHLLGLPIVIRNLDAGLTPLAAGAVGLSALVRRPRLGRRQAAPFIALTLLAAVTTFSWILGNPRSPTSLGLAFTVLLVWPIILTLACVGTAFPGSNADLLALRGFVLLQLIVGVAQYVGQNVAQRAPFAADLVDGTTSHNFWPAFALPAAAALFVIERGWTRWVWPLAVSVLAVYAEAKAALIVYLPVLIVLALVAVATWAKARWLARHATSSAGTWQAIGRAALASSAVAVIAVGLAWTPSVQGTWRVFVGHTSQLAEFQTGNAPSQDSITYRQALRALGDALPASPRTMLTGLGPANSVSHAAQVLVERSADGSTPAGLVARRLLTDPGDLQFEDAQSSLLGVVGDIGLLGGLGWVAVVALAFRVLCGTPRQWRAQPLAALMIAGTLVGVMAGGVLLDWPEQASIALPVALTLMTVSRHSRRLPRQTGPSTGAPA